MAKVPQRRDQAYFPKDAFRIDLERMAGTCPVGHVCRIVAAIGSDRRYGALGISLRGFRFDGAPCDD